MSMEYTTSIHDFLKEMQQNEIFEQQVEVEQIEQLDQQEQKAVQPNKKRKRTTTNSSKNKSSSASSSQKKRSTPKFKHPREYIEQYKDKEDALSLANNVVKYFGFMALHHIHRFMDLKMFQQNQQDYTSVLQTIRQVLIGELNQLHLDVQQGKLVDHQFKWICVRYGCLVLKNLDSQCPEQWKKLKKVLTAFLNQWLPERKKFVKREYELLQFWTEREQEQSTRKLDNWLVEHSNNNSSSSSVIQ